MTGLADTIFGAVILANGLTNHAITSFAIESGEAQALTVHAKAVLVTVVFAAGLDLAVLARIVRIAITTVVLAKSAVTASNATLTLLGAIGS